MIKNMSLLKVLNISNNKIETLPIEIVETPNLEDFIINDNPICNDLGGKLTFKWKEELREFILKGTRI